MKRRKLGQPLSLTDEQLEQMATTFTAEDVAAAILQAQATHPPLAALLLAGTDVDGEVVPPNIPLLGGSDGK